MAVTQTRKAQNSISSRPQSDPAAAYATPGWGKFINQKGKGIFRHFFGTLKAFLASNMNYLQPFFYQSLVPKKLTLIISEPDFST